MTTNRIQNDGRNGLRAATLPTQKDARRTLEYAIIALGRDAIFRWITSGQQTRSEATRRVLFGEPPEAVARDFAQ